MADYGTYETTRQSAQPAELYKFFWGNDSVAGTSAHPAPAELGPCCGEVPDLAYDPATVYAVDAFDGADTASLVGRTPDGGGDTSLDNGTWAHVTDSGTAIGITGNVAVRSSGSGTDAHYVLTGSGAGTDYGVEATGAFGAAPGGNTWFAVLARQDATDETGVELRLTASGPGLVLSTNVSTDPLTTFLANEVQFITVPALGTGPHTIRLDAIGDQFFGYLDDELLIAASIDDFEFIAVPATPGSHSPMFETGHPGLCMSTQGVGNQVSVTQFRVAAPGVIPAPCASGSRTLMARDGFDGADVADIEGRSLDGGGTSAAQGTWSKIGTSNFNISIADDGAHQTTAAVLPLTQAVYLAEGITGLPADYSVECVMQIGTAHTIPTFRDNWITLKGRVPAGDVNSGYEAFAQFFPTSTGDNPVTIGGMEFGLYKMTAGVYTELAYSFNYHGTPDLGVDHTLGLCITGTTLCLYWNGKLQLTAEDGTHTAAGSPGLGMLDGNTVAGHGDGTTFTVSEFSVYAVDPAAYVADTTALLELNYTSADVEIEYEGSTYVPFIAHRTSFNSGSGERTASEIDLSVPFDHPVATLARQGVPRGPIGVTVYRLDRQDTTDGAAAIPLQGQITRIRETSDRWTVITIGNTGTLLTRKLPRMLTQRTCPHVLGGPFCQVDLSAFTHADLTVSSIAGRQVTVEGAATAGGSDTTYFQEGVLLTADGLREFIESQSGDTLTLKQVVPGLGLDDTVTLIAGCDHQARTCDTRFANIARFGGEIGIPDRNPWTGAGLIGPGSTVEPV